MSAGGRIHVTVGELQAAAGRLAVIRDVLADLDQLDVDDADLGAPEVAAATREVQHGWELHRVALTQRLATLSGFVDAAVTAAQQADATVVTGRVAGP